MSTSRFVAALGAVVLGGCTVAPAEEANGSGSALSETAGSPKLEETALGYVLILDGKAEIAHCAATLIAPKVVVTSASCADPVAFDPSYTPAKKYAFAVSFLRDPNQLSVGDNYGKYIHAVKSTVLPARWMKLSAEERRGQGQTIDPPVPSKGLDIAALILDAPVTTEPFKLDVDESGITDLEATGKPATLAGFGGTRSPSNPVLARRGLAVKVRDASARELILADTPKGLGGADAGGPLLRKDKNGKEVLSGVLGKPAKTRGAGSQILDVLSFTTVYGQEAFLDGIVVQNRR